MIRGKIAIRCRNLGIDPPVPRLLPWMCKMKGEPIGLRMAAASGRASALESGNVRACPASQEAAGEVDALLSLTGTMFGVAVAVVAVVGMLIS